MPKKMFGSLGPGNVAEALECMDERTLERDDRNG